MPEPIKRPERLPLIPTPVPDNKLPFPVFVTQVGQSIFPVVEDKVIGPTPAKAFLAL